MAEPLANELVECILDHLDSDLDLDKDTLLSCALVARAWVPASQRGIFRKVLLHPYKAAHDREPYEAFLALLSRLIAVFDENPRLATYVRSLALYDIRFKKEIYASMSSVVQRLSKVKELSFTLVGWRFLSSSLREALSNLVKAPSFCMLWTDEICDLASLSSEAKYLKSLGVVNRSSFSKELFSSTALPRSIKLDHLLLRFQRPDLFAGGCNPHYRAPIYFTMTEWLQEESCPFEVGCLQSLRIQNEWLDPQIASILQQVGASLGELELQDFRQSSNAIHLGYTPNLHTLKLVNLHQSDLYTPVPWIESLLEPLLDGNWSKPFLRSLVINLDISNHTSAIEIHQWDRWSGLDVLLRKTEFFLLQTVEITVTAHLRITPAIVREILIEKLRFLNESGKLKLIIESNRDVGPPGGHLGWLSSLSPPILRIPAPPS